MTKDPYQLNNVVSDPAYAAVKAALREKLTGWIERVEHMTVRIED